MEASMSGESTFLSDFHVEDITEGLEVQTLRLLSEFRVYTESIDAIITVPAGFIFDGESIPLFLQWLAPPFGQSRRAACVHDYLYRYQGYHSITGAVICVSRAEADRVYCELIRAKGLPWWRANLRWGILRLVGWAAWRSNRKQQLV